MQVHVRVAPLRKRETNGLEIPTGRSYLVNERNLSRQGALFGFVRYRLRNAVLKVPLRLPIVPPSCILLASASSSAD